VKTIDMEPMPDIPVEAAAEVALDIAMSIEDVDMCDISILAGEELLKGEGRVGGTTRAFQQVDGLIKRAIPADERRFNPDGQVGHRRKFQECSQDEARAIEKMERTTGNVNLRMVLRE
jgi:hypothetical protein